VDAAERIVRGLLSAEGRRAYRPGLAKAKLAGIAARRGQYAEARRQAEEAFGGVRARRSTIRPTGMPCCRT